MGNLSGMYEHIWAGFRLFPSAMIDARILRDPGCPPQILRGLGNQVMQDL